ncbi:hypothetical protein PAMP_017997 [Pampus punctatissimus]
MTLLLTHHTYTHTRASADADGEAGPGLFAGLWYLYLKFAQSSKILQNRSIIQKMRRERRGPVDNTADTQGRSAGLEPQHSVLLSFFTITPVRPRQNRDTTRCVSMMGDYNYRAPE